MQTSASRLPSFDPSNDPFDATGEGQPPDLAMIRKEVIVYKINVIKKIIPTPTKQPKDKNGIAG